MAKRSTGASEINGFIAVTNDKSKTTSKPPVIQKTSSSSLKLSSGSKDVKTGKVSVSNPAVKKAVPGEAKKAETTPKAPVKSKITEKLGTKATDSKSVPNKKLTGSKEITASKSTPNVGAAKSTPVKVQSSTSVKSTPAPKARVGDKIGAPSRANATKSKTATSTVKKETVQSQKPSSRPVVAAPKAAKDDKTANSTKSVPKAQAPKPGPKTSQEVKSKTIGVKKPVQNGSTVAKRLPVGNQKPKPKPAVGPGKAAPLKAGTVLKEKDVLKSSDGERDDEDEEVRKSLPHILAPDELDISQETGTSQYEEDDFEDYESDFEEEASDTESSYTESSVSAAQNARQKSARKSAKKPRPAGIENTIKRDDAIKNMDPAPSSAKSVVSQSVGHPVQPPAPDNEYDYEDDFEDYSSDFEEDTESGFTSSNETSESASSTDTSADVDIAKAARLKGKVVEEEKKLDSGNYDLKTTITRSDIIKQSQLNYIKEAISRENTMFKDGMPVEKSPSPPPLQIMDFKAAFDKTDEPRGKRATRIPGRGKILLSMIKLHVMVYDIFEMQPMSYEDYIKLKGNSNNIQEETQTGDDDMWEETQTDEIVMENKWTQCPVSYHSWAGKDVDWKVYLEDKRGYGTDELLSLDSRNFFASNYNTKRLQNFVTNASQVITVLLEEEAHDFKNTLSLQQSDSNLGFSDGYVPIYCDDIDFLKDRRVTHVFFSPHFSNVVVTCYDKSPQPEEYLPIEVMNRWLICLWDMIAVSQPLKILVASSPVESLVFDCLYSDLLYAGLSDGLVCLWDMSEPDMEHDRCRRPNFDTILRTPTYCSYSSGLDTKEIHTNPVICLRSTSGGVKRPADDAVTPTTLLSLSDDGKLLIWTVVRIPDSSAHLKKIDVRVSPWGRVRLALISVHHPRETAPRESRHNIDFLCMEVKQTNTSLLLGTNMGFVLQYPLTKFKTQTSRFGEINSSVHITDIELCPHDKRCFLVGVSDGSLRLHTEFTSRPLKVFTVSNLLASGISSIRWSNFKPGLIVTLDNDSNLLVWNLCQSDLQPVVKMSFKAAVDERTEILKKALASSPIPPDRLEKIVKFMLPASGLRSGPRISRMDLSRDIRLPYLGIVVSGATVHVHRFSNEFAAKGADIEHQDLEVLRRYLDLLHK